MASKLMLYSANASPAALLHNAYFSAAANPAAAAAVCAGPLRSSPFAPQLSALSPLRGYTGSGGGVGGGGGYPATSRGAMSLGLAAAAAYSPHLLHSLAGFGYGYGAVAATMTGGAQQKVSHMYHPYAAATPFSTSPDK